MADTPRVLVHTRDPAPLLERLEQAMPAVAARGHDSYDGLGPVLAEFRPDVVYSIAFDGRAGYPREALLGEGGPRWIAVGGSGVDHLRPWQTDAVTVTNAAGVAAPMMAEYVLGCALHFTLDVPGLQADKAAHRWRERTMTPLAGKTVLIVGLGQTGQAVAARARAFGMHVIGTRARPAPMENLDEVHAAADLPGLWERADLIVVSVPLLDSTRGLVDEGAFTAMKDSAILIDVSRGGVVDTDAFVEAMRRGAIAGAARDVFETEPLPPDSPVWELENVIVSPHCSAVYDGWNMAAFEMFMDNLERWQRGAPLRNVVNPQRGY